MKEDDDFLEEEMRYVVSTHVGTWDVDAMWERANGVKKRSYAHFLAIAAGILILIAGIKFIPTKTPATSFTTVATTIGQRASTKLPDGTRIILAPGSTIRYGSNYNANTREVDLQGEAYFDVISTNERPFAVKTGNTLTRVLGTSFTVRKYENDADVRVIVATGKVAIGNMTLARGDLAIVDVNGQTQLSHIANPDIFTSWTRDTIAFERVTAAEVIGTFNRWYGLNLKPASGPAARELYTGSFVTTGRSADDAARFVKLLMGE